MPLADRGCDADWFRNGLTVNDIHPSIPSRKGHKATDGHYKNPACDRCPIRLRAGRNRHQLRMIPEPKALGCPLHHPGAGVQAMAIFTDFAIGGNFPGFALATSGAALEVTSVTSTRAELRNPVTGAVTVLTGTGLAAAAGGAAAPVTGTMTGFEVRVPEGAGTVPTFQATGLLWSAAEFLGAARDAALPRGSDFTRLDEILNLQPITYDARNAVLGVGFSYQGLTSDLTLFGSDFRDTLRGGVGNDTIRGGDGDDVIYSGSNSGGDLIDAGTGFDTVFFGLGAGDSHDSRYVLSHRSLGDSTGIVATLSDRFSAAPMIDKGSFGQTNLYGLNQAFASGGTLSIEGTGLDDRFDITFTQGGYYLPKGFVGLTPGRGNDTVRAEGYGNVGLDFATDSNGIAALQGVVMDLTTGAVANDGFGFADVLLFDLAIGVSVTLTAWSDTLSADYRSGTLRGGDGIDTLDYGTVAIQGEVFVDLAAGWASWRNTASNWSRLAHTVEGFENLIGTREYSDRLSGTHGANLIEGLGGSDAIMGDGFRAAYSHVYATKAWQFYQAVLNRAPETVELNALAEQFYVGAPGVSDRLRVMADDLSKGTEFGLIYGALDDAEFVTQLYRNLLDRAPDVQGMTDWLGTLGWAGRGVVALGFAGSQEFIRRTLAEANGFADTRNEANWADDLFRLYRATLDRAPDAAGFLDWLGRLGGGTTFRSVVEGFTGSAEFRNTYGTSDDTSFVALLYRNVLDRASDVAGLADWLGRLATGTTRAEVVAGFAQSREFVNDTAEAVTDFVRGFGGGDTLDGGAGDNRLWGGMLADAFVFDADDMAHHRVMDFEAWDRLVFRDFGYDDAFDIRRHLTQSGADVVFQDQSVTVTLSNTQLAAITDDSLTFF